jgi:hypothetical protein
VKTGPTRLSCCRCIVARLGELIGGLLPGSMVLREGGVAEWPVQGLQPRASPVVRHRWTVLKPPRPPSAISITLHLAPPRNTPFNRATAPRSTPQTVHTHFPCPASDSTAVCRPNRATQILSRISQSTFVRHTPAESEVQLLTAQQRSLWRRAQECSYRPSSQ